MKLSKIYRNMVVHNVFAHPLMQILNLVGTSQWANCVHDNTLPDETLKSKCINAIKDCCKKVSCTAADICCRKSCQIDCSFEDLDVTEDAPLSKKD